MLNGILFRVFYRAFCFHLLEKEGIGKSRDIQEDRALYHIFKYTPTGKAGCGHPEQGERVGGGQPLTKGTRRKEG